MARRLTAMAREVNEDLEGFTAVVEPSESSTDRRIRNGGRHLLVRGKGRRGYRLIVTGPDGARVIDHDNSGTYRTNAEAEEQVAYLRDGIRLGVSLDGRRCWDPEYRQRVNQARRAVVSTSESTDGNPQR